MAGSKFEVGTVLLDSLNLVIRRPIIALPLVVLILISTIMLLPLILSISTLESQFDAIGNWVVPFVISLIVVCAIILFIACVLLMGAYPLIVRDAILGDKINFRRALDVAVERFFTVAGALILVTILTLLGMIFFVIPGLIVMTWYFYSIPAIILEGRNVDGGLSASKVFARDKKFKTFLLYIVPDLGYNVLFTILSIGGEYMLPVGLILIIIYIVWVNIIPSYVYIEYAIKNASSEDGLDTEDVH